MKARALVNAAGPWAAQFLAEHAHAPRPKSLRLVKGSHIVVPKMFEHEHAYIFQNPDKRIIFAIPYEGEFTLIGTTDVEHHGAIGAAKIDADEIAYLCEQASRYFAPGRAAGRRGVELLRRAPAARRRIGRPLGGDARLRARTRHAQAPLLSVWGGKITTFRKLAEEAADLLAAPLKTGRGAWTEGSFLPGGDLSASIGAPQRPDTDFSRFVRALALAHPNCPRRWCAAWRAPTARAPPSCCSVARAAPRWRRAVRVRAAVPARRGMGRRRRRAVAAQQAGPALRRTPPRRGGRLVPRALGQLGRDRPRDGDDMELTLERIEQKVGAATHLYPLDLKLAPRAVTVLLGATQTGKTTLMRVMAGLDAPHAGRVIADGQDVTGVPVRERNVAMVYQQFINYPSMSVADNIASPLNAARRGQHRQRVQELAAAARRFLKRLPAELSAASSSAWRWRALAKKRR